MFPILAGYNAAKSLWFYTTLRRFLHPEKHNLLTFKTSHRHEKCRSFRQTTLRVVNNRLSMHRCATNNFTFYVMSDTRKQQRPQVLSRSRCLIVCCQNRYAFLLRCSLHACIECLKVSLHNLLSLTGKHRSNGIS